MRRILYSVLAAWLLAGLTGCGGRGVPLVAVRGTVTLDGQPVPGAGTLYFTPAAPAQGLPGRPGKASFGKSGKYAAGSFGDGDGLIPGLYKVAVHCWEVPPTIGGPAPKSYIAGRYRSASTSGIEVAVSPHASAQAFDIDLQP